MTADGLPGTAAPGVPAPPPGLVVLGRYDESPGYFVNRPQGPDSWLFTWTTGGSGHLRHGSAVARAGTGDLVALAPGSPHGYGVEPGAGHWRFWWVHCQARPTWLPWLRPYDRGDGLYVVTPTPTALHGRVEAAFHRMHDSPDDRIAVAHDTAARELALCALEEVVLLTATGARRRSPIPGLDPRIARVQELIAADPGAPHTVDSLAAHVSLSPSRLTHLFTRQVGRSPMRALREARLRHAARLLEVTDLSVERVALASGFASPFHFHRVFRERFGMPPGVYRSGGPMVGA
ncbi:AraC family transcriptional regulator [Streptomyces sp. Act143]|uniref:helix-turn-helix domain-containing protein n=1 Tax=Streptomyces sp. Act143 TaxID=2200760 RepID=UPI000D67D28B|nr:helix-turn-helix domain-containing protein [Streptomyces sp. Act143]PWI13745.1 AraC family transcriptional regulator [Streptomyces sp. Act143]